MSRHRHFRNINVEDELNDEDPDADYYGKSVDDPPISADAAQFLYHREQSISEENPNDFNEQEDYDDYYENDDDDMFDMDDVAFQTKQSSSKPKTQPKKTAASQQTGPKKGMFAIGDDEKASRQSKKTAPLPALEQLKISEVKTRRGTSKSPARMTPNASFHQLSAIEVAQNANSTHKERHRDPNSKPQVNLVIVGHVDAGKSTLVGHLLYMLGQVDEKAMNRYKQQSNRIGKGSFAFAWILDDTEEERERGVTMDIAHASFETTKRRFNILDAPGHRDFIPNMITGASQADAALLVVNASRGEFESGFDLGGQTREHALLLRALGVQKVMVAVNKMDTIEWNQERYDEVVDAMKSFLKKQAGFSAVKFIPVSGLGGENLLKRPDNTHPLTQWYDGPTLSEILDTIDPPLSSDDKPLRLIVNDTVKTTNNSLSFTGKIETGHLESGDRVYVMPKADAAVVKAVNVADSESQHQSVNTQNVCFAGDQVLVTLSGTFESGSVSSGSVICRGGPELLVPVKLFVAKLILFDDALPILKGSRAECYSHAIRVPCIVAKLRSIINKQNGEVIKANPRVITKGMSAIVEISTDYPVCVEPYSKTKQLGRVSLRINGRTVGAGIIDEIINSEFSLNSYADDPVPCIAKHGMSLAKRMELRCDYLPYDKCIAYVAYNESYIVFSVRGTTTKLQLITELVETMTASIYNEGGFGKLLKKLKKTYPNATLLFSGHSLGGAIVSLASSMFSYDNPQIPVDQIRLITFGQPRVGNMDYSVGHDLHVPNSWRIVHRFDIVAHLPYCYETLWSHRCTPLYNHGPYHHGTEIWYPGNMTITKDAYQICTEHPYNEDDTCSNAEWKHFNVNDHLVYFDKDVSNNGVLGCPV
ncbi:HBS1-like protein [Aphelenchoides besseyi]|nr:HBS1-like protein [Aphelenchoides besseyi]